MTLEQKHHIARIIARIEITLDANEEPTILLVSLDKAIEDQLKREDEIKATNKRTADARVKAIREQMSK